MRVPLWTLGVLVLAAAVGVAGEPQGVRESARRIPLAEDADVLVVGGTTGGVAAAAQAARAGAGRVDHPLSLPGRRRVRYAAAVGRAGPAGRLALDAPAVRPLARSADARQTGPGPVAARCRRPLLLRLLPDRPAAGRPRQHRRSRDGQPGRSAGRPGQGADRCHRTGDGRPLGRSRLWAVPGRPRRVPARGRGRGTPSSRGRRGAASVARLVRQRPAQPGLRMCPDAADGGRFAGLVRSSGTAGAGPDVPTPATGRRRSDCSKYRPTRWKGKLRARARGRAPNASTWPCSARAGSRGCMSWAAARRSRGKLHASWCAPAP